MSAVVEDEIHRRLEAENADRGNYDNLANRLERMAINEKDPGRAGKLRSMAQALRKIASDEEHHLQALTKIYQDLGRLSRTTGPVVTVGAGLAEVGKGAAHVAAKGLTAVGKRLSALETEGGRLPVVSSRDVTEGLGMPGQPMRGVLPGSYYLDARLRELRHTQNPSNVIRLNEFEVDYFKGKAR